MYVGAVNMFFENSTTTTTGGYPSSEEVTGLEVTFIAAAIIAGSIAVCSLAFCFFNHCYKAKINDLDPEKAHNLGPYPVSVGSKIELIR